jgi:hypothetical protein
MDHADEEIADRYAERKQDVEFRQAVAKRIGLRFELPAKTVLLDQIGGKSNFRPFQKLSLHARDLREISGAPGEIRTPDILLRRQMLYPTELRARGEQLPQCTAPAVFPATGISRNWQVDG